MGMAGTTTAVAATVGGAVAAGGLLASVAGDKVAFAEWSLWSGAVVTLAIAHRVVNKTHYLTACLLKPPPLSTGALVTLAIVEGIAHRHGVLSVVLLFFLNPRTSTSTTPSIPAPSASKEPYPITPSSVSVAGNW